MNHPTPHTSVKRSRGPQAWRLGGRCASSTTGSCWQPAVRSCCRQSRKAAPRRAPTWWRWLAAPLLQLSHLHLLYRHVAATSAAEEGASTASGGLCPCSSCPGSPTFHASKHLCCRRLPSEGCWCEGRCGRAAAPVLATAGAAAVAGLMAGWGVPSRAGGSRLHQAHMCACWAQLPMIACT